MPRTSLKSFGKGLSGTGWPDDSLAMIHRSEQLLRPLIPSMATEEAEVWRATAIEANGVLLKESRCTKRVNAFCRLDAPVQSNIAQNLGL